MIPVERELDRTLTLLRNKIREQGFTQLQVQAELAWGRSYISQLLTKQKSLRVEQVLRILQVIDVEPADFYKELYRFSEGDGMEHNEAYGNNSRGGKGSFGAEVAQKDLQPGITTESLQRKLDRSARTLKHVVQLLVDKEFLSEEDRATLNLNEADNEDAAN